MSICLLEPNSLWLSTIFAQGNSDLGRRFPVESSIVAERCCIFFFFFYMNGICTLCRTHICTASGFEFRNIFLLERFPTTVIVFCYLTHIWGERIDSYLSRGCLCESEYNERGWNLNSAR